ncbi:MAG: sialate O-acetylesterase [Oscillospiraceae bacterium]|nr:sialate O-acetylesterase [Oscillospiraceae bacterium]
MQGVKNYSILQRNSEGFAEAFFNGELPEWYTGDRVCGRVVSEKDNSVVVDWSDCKIDGRKWELKVNVPQGGLYRFEVRPYDENDTAFEWVNRFESIYHFGVGDLYIIAGQSNMSGYGRDFAYDPPSLNVHLYKNNGTWDIATHPLNDSVGTIYPENAENGTGTSPALSFARRIHEELGIPIGLVQASLGGSSLARWHPKEEGSLYRAMLRRLEVVGSVKGVLWYQGCADAGEEASETYLERFADMVNLWRQEIGHIPFLTVQLNRWAGSTGEVDRYWAKLKDAQRRAALEIEDVFVVPSSDCAVNDGIHNSSTANVIIGERLALTALSGVYGRSGRLAPNVLSAKRVDTNSIFIEFGEEFYVRAMDNKGFGLNIEDKDGIIDCVSAVPKGKGLLITAERDFQLPASFHAVWRCNTPAFIPKDVYGMPMLSCYGVEIT